MDSTAAPSQENLEQYRSYLFRYALIQLRDADRAEDVVQETLLAALESRSAFSGRSSRKTWLTGILKHKIIDQIRRASREQSIDASGEADAETDIGDLAALFKTDGHWDDMPQSWADPVRQFENRRFWEAYELCANLLPRNSARVFMMRELLGMDTGEICKELDITATNCWVLLYRARMSLRLCLDKKWFGNR